MAVRDAVMLRLFCIYIWKCGKDQAWQDFENMCLMKHLLQVAALSLSIRAWLIFAWTDPVGFALQAGPFHTTMNGAKHMTWSPRVCMSWIWMGRPPAASTMWQSQAWSTPRRRQSHLSAGSKLTQLGTSSSLGVWWAHATFGRGQQASPDCASHSPIAAFHSELRRDCRGNREGGNYWG